MIAEPDRYRERVATAKALLARIAEDFSPAALASSLAAEDMVLTDMILRTGLPITIFTLDTGRLHRETLEMVERIHRNYGYAVAIYRPDPQAVAEYVAEHGPDAFYDSVELRHRCCQIRKVEPLGRALAGKAAWITGQRRSQSVTRNTLEIREYDSAHQVAKFNPLVDWSDDHVWHYLRSNGVPTNPLHERGYPSIGCEPCTRAVQPGEDIRAGRWWWEQPQSKECGLHMENGRLVRATSDRESIGDLQS